MQPIMFAYYALTVILFIITTLSAAGFEDNTLASNSEYVTFSIVTGSGVDGNSNNVPASTASIGICMGVIVGSDLSVYLSDYEYRVIRKFSVTSSGGFMTTYAGNGQSTSVGSDVPATSASFSEAYGIGIDSRDNVYIADFAGYAVRVVTSSQGKIKSPSGELLLSPHYMYTFSGTLGTAGTYAYGLYSVTVDRNDDVFVANVNVIYKVTGGYQGTVAVYFGTGSQTSSCTSTNSIKTIGFVYSMTVDKNNNLFIADFSCSRVLKITNTSIVTVVAGSGVASNSQLPNAVNATATPIGSPFGVTVDSDGRYLVIPNYYGAYAQVYVVDTWENLMYLVTSNYAPYSSNLPRGYVYQTAVTAFVAAAFDKNNKLYLTTWVGFKVGAITGLTFSSSSPTFHPISAPTQKPTLKVPTSYPTLSNPTRYPTIRPPTYRPSCRPSNRPTGKPTYYSYPTAYPNYFGDDDVNSLIIGLPSTLGIIVVCIISFVVFIIIMSVIVCLCVWANRRSIYTSSANAPFVPTTTANVLTSVETGTTPEPSAPALPYEPPQIPDITVIYAESTVVDHENSFAVATVVEAVPTNDEA